MNNNRLTAELGQQLIDANNHRIAPHVVADIAYKTLYNADVDGLLAAELSDHMYQLARFIKPPARNKNKSLKAINHFVDQTMLTTVLTFDDYSSVNIFVQRGMIFVADCSYAELTERIEADEYDAYESYDTVDNTDYYKRSEYAEYITSALLYLSNRFL